MRALFCAPVALLLVFSTPSPAAPAGTATPSKASPSTAKSKRLSDSQIKRLMIKESIAEYPGNCPCPYHSASNGSSCGGRSAWSRAGGASPLCFEKDVSADMVAEYRSTHTDN